MPNIQVLNEIQVKQSGVITTYKIGTVNGYYNSANGKFYEESTYITEIEGAPNLVYADIAGNNLYIWKAATSSFVKVSGEGGSGGLVYGYLNDIDGKFYEDDQYTTEIPGDEEKLFITLDNNYIYRYDLANTEFIQIGGGESAAFVLGYYNSTDGKFYEESTYTTEIPANENNLYISLDTNYIYRYDLTETEYIQIAKDEPDAIIYVSALPSTNIKNVIYALNSEIDHIDTITANFLDDNDLFEKEIIDENNYKYVPASGVEIKASIDDTVYKPFSYLQYDDTFMNWTIVFTDGTNDTLNTGDDFYYKEIKDMFYAGNAEEQVLTPLAAGGSGGGGAEYAPGEGISISNSVISVLPATAADIGGVKPDQTTITINQDGVIRGNYQAGHGVKITNNTISDRTFIGTQAEWDTLTPAQQAEYDMISISDDGAPVDLTSGHIIVNGSGTAFTQRNNLQFEDVNVTDDSVNSSTVITPIPYTAGSKIDITNKEISVDSTVKGTFIGTQAEWNALSSTDKAKYDIVNLTDDNITPATVVDTVANGDMNPVTSNAVYDAIGQGYILVEDNYFTYSVDATIGATKTYREFLNECNAEFISKFQTLANNEVMEIVGIQATGNSMAINGTNIIRRLYGNSTTGLTINTVGSVMDASTPAMKVAQIRFHSTTSRFYITITTASGSSLTVNDSTAIGSAYEMQIYYRKYRKTTT